MFRRHIFLLNKVKKKKNEVWPHRLLTPPQNRENLNFSDFVRALFIKYTTEVNQFVENVTTSHHLDIHKCNKDHFSTKVGFWGGPNLHLSKYHTYYCATLATRQFRAHAPEHFFFNYYALY